MIDVKELIKKILTPEMGTISNANGYINLFGLLICWGNNTQAVSSAQATTWQTTFVKEFKYTPVVFTQIIETISPHVFHVAANDITTNGCTWRRTSTSSTSYNCTINWVAIGISA